MQQIASNLLLNAAEAIEDRAGVISVETGVRQLSKSYIHRRLEGAQAAPGRYVYLAVSDNGCGMDQATRSRIFDPFFTTKFTGRGLGLAAVAGIVRSHNGAIEVASAPGKGSTFTVWLPAMEQAAAPAQSASAAKKELRGDGTILVADDEEVVREMARRALERYGYEVKVADSGPAAIDLLARESDRISLVVLDLSMPGMGGREALPALRRVKPGIPVLISSGYNEDETMRLSAGVDVAGFIQKPYTPSQLAQKVKAARGRTTGRAGANRTRHTHGNFYAASDSR